MTTSMQSPREILADIWRLAGGAPAALNAIILTGEEPQLPSSFRVGAAAQASIAASGLAAAEIWSQRGGKQQQVSVDMTHAVAECRSERYLRLDGKPPPPAWDPTAGVYRTRDIRFVRLHTNFPHHRTAVCNVLACAEQRDAIQAALMQWDGEAFESAAYTGGAVVSLMRSHDEWLLTPQAQALANLPPLTIEKLFAPAPRFTVMVPASVLPPRSTETLSAALVRLTRTFLAPVNGLPVTGVTPSNT